ncbi:hypothetical protein BDV96DRAFT_283662 [Lophiotrema nucula]|uniref:Uncharacterized protein n=1 Tax=Lophiotrema nucula TaxID=690887 RepID=A0A6A5YN32_9PLEO|nr:hypothetical protein BDV96DRAFT_283662 [Lophiotrema nucula]
MRATRFHYVNSRGTQSIVSSAALVQQAQADQADALHAVCVVENISPEYIKDLVAGLRLYPTFFLEHAIHTPKDQFWELHHSWDPATTLSDSSVPFNSAHIDGMFEYHELEYSHKSDLTSAPNFVQRDCFIQEPFPIQSNTRISYYRVSPWLCKYHVLPNCEITA